MWLTTAQTELTIVACPIGYCGSISKIVIPEAIKQQYGDQLELIDPAAFTDANNKDPALQGRPIQGLQILALRQTGNPMFYEGEIYNPEDGNIYSVGGDALGRSDPAQGLRALCALPGAGLVADRAGSSGRVGGSGALCFPPP